MNILMDSKIWVKYIITPLNDERLKSKMLFWIGEAKQQPLT